MPQTCSTTRPAKPKNNEKKKSWKPRKRCFASKPTWTAKSMTAGPSSSAASAAWPSARKPWTRSWTTWKSARSASTRSPKRYRPRWTRPSASKACRARSWSASRASPPTRPPKSSSAACRRKPTMTPPPLCATSSSRPARRATRRPATSSPPPSSAVPATMWPRAPCRSSACPTTI